MQSRRSKKIFQHQDASIRSLCFLLSLLQGWRGRNFGVFVPILLKRSRKFFRTLKTASSSQLLQSHTFRILYTCLIINCKRFEARSHFMSRWSMIVGVKVVLNRAVLDNTWGFDNSAVVIHYKSSVCSPKYKGCTGDAWPQALQFNTKLIHKTLVSTSSVFDSHLIVK